MFVLFEIRYIILDFEKTECTMRSPKVSTVGDYSRFIWQIKAELGDRVPAVQIVCRSEYNYIVIKHRPLNHRNDVSRAKHQIECNVLKCIVTPWSAKDLLIKSRGCYVLLGEGSTLYLVTK